MNVTEKFGIWYSRPGNGVSHPVHAERFAQPGKCSTGFAYSADYNEIEEGDILITQGIRKQLNSGGKIIIRNQSKDGNIEVVHSMSPRQVSVMLEGGVINHFRKEK